jgi:Fe-S-cluster containining protein
MLKTMPDYRTATRLPSCIHVIETFAAWKSTCKGEVMIETLKGLLHGNAPRTEQRVAGCLCCGECCKAFGGHLHASKSDLERWWRDGREDLLCRVNRLGWIWVNPDTMEPEERCPFLKQSGPETIVCAIYDTRPDICRAYPTLAHGRRCLRGVFLKR